MSVPLVFSEILDAVEQLDSESQSEFVAILTRRMAERGRDRIHAAVVEARREFKAGECQAMTAAELVREASA